MPEHAYPVARRVPIIESRLPKHQKDNKFIIYIDLQLDWGALIPQLGVDVALEPLGLTFFVYRERRKRAVESQQPWPVCLRAFCKNPGLLSTEDWIRSGLFLKKLFKRLQCHVETSAANVLKTNLSQKNSFPAAIVQVESRS